LYWLCVLCLLPVGVINEMNKLCFLLRYQASQMEISKQNSTKRCQPVDSKSPKLGAQKLYTSVRIVRQL